MTLTKRLALFIALLSLLFLFGTSSTMSFAQYIGNNNLYFTNENTGGTCGVDGMYVTIQPTVDYNEIASTGAVTGDYGYQLQIFTPTLFENTKNTIGYQQTIGVYNSQIVNAGVENLPGYVGNSSNPFPLGINPGLTTTSVEFYQDYNTNQQVTLFGWEATYESNGNKISIVTTLPVTNNFQGAPWEYQMDIVGDPGQIGGYADFLAGQGTITYEGTGPELSNYDCHNFVTTEDSNIQYQGPGYYCIAVYYCTQDFSALPLQLSLSASPSSPTIGQSVQLTATVNQALQNASKLTVNIFDETTGQLIYTCSHGSTYQIGNQCSTSVQENSITSQEFYATLSGYGGYIMSSSSNIIVNWNNPVLTVNSENQNLQSITGYYTVLEQNGNQIGTGYTPVSFTLAYDQTYTVYVDNYGSCTFSYWADNGNTNRERTFTSTQSFTFTAAYDCSSTGSVTVNTVNQNGQAITGYYVGLYNSGGTLINHGFSPVTFSGLSVGTTYSVEPDNYGSCTFNHWQDTGSTVRDRSFTAASSQTFTAVYDCT